jgi:predicted nucleotidyltransferase
MEAVFLKEGDKQPVLENITRILSKRQEILFAYLFGSFVHDTGFHDVDVGIYLREDVSPFPGPGETFALEVAVGLELEKNLGYPADVKVLNRAPVALCHAVTGGRVLLSRDETKRLSWVERTWSRYLDMRYFFRSSLLDLLGTE